MRDYGSTHMPFWLDDQGNCFVVPSRSQRPRYKYPSHAALRSFVYRRDGFMCKTCGTSPSSIPDGYDGHETLKVPRRSKAGFGSMLVIDHIVSLRNGGTNHPDNLQTLCDCCNAAKSGLIDSKFGRQESANG